ncbi:T9SS C-terminal target domain-containing protein [Sphingobacteriales bacterium UPWRP_1]|nr:hypothetical protein BVG80_13005 [Sphingobacteriales bacterium TSM_CSM]PSJ75803.1 T9SS C-terminal target domain-containing protein [Sphingobacteriales bacterium UPWRP_1]
METQSTEEDENYCGLMELPCDNVITMHPQWYYDMYPIETIRLRFHVLQKSAMDPQNLIAGNPDHEAFFANVEQNTNDILGGLDTPKPDLGYGVIKDTRLRVKVESIDYYADEDLWNFSPLEFENIYNGWQWVSTTFIDKTEVAHALLGATMPNNAIDVYLPGNFNDMAVGNSASYGQANVGSRWIWIRNFYAEYLNFPFTYIDCNVGDGISPWRILAHEVLHLYGGEHPEDIWDEANCADLEDEEYNTNNILDNTCDEVFEGEASLSQCQMDMIECFMTGNFTTNSEAFINDYCEKKEGQDIIVNQPGQVVSFSKPRSLRGDLIVETGTTLILNSLLAMPHEGRIIVKRGAKLIVNGQYSGLVTNGRRFKLSMYPSPYINAPNYHHYGVDICNEKWQGIEVWGNAAINHADLFGAGTLNLDAYENLVLTENDPGVVILKNCARIENAVTAISTKRGGGYYPDYNGGIVYAENSSFNNNRCATEFLQYLPQNLSQFRNCTFNSNEPISRPYITMWDTHGIYLFGNTFNGNNNSTVNETAIYSIDAGYNLVASNVFKDLTMGVCATSGGANALLQIGDPVATDYNPSVANQFENCRIGLYMAGMFYAEVKNNYFLNCHVGVYNDGSEKVTTECNQFEHPNTANTHTDVLYFNTGGSESLIRNNTFVNSYNSVFAWLNNRGLKIKCNDNLQVAYNLVVSGDITGSGLTGSINSEQGTMDNSSDAPASNKFGAYFNPSTHIHTQGTTLTFNYVHHKNMVYVPIYDAGAYYTKQEHNTYYNEVCFPNDVAEGCSNPPCNDFIEDIKAEIEVLHALLTQYSEGSFAYNALSEDIDYLTYKLDAALKGTVAYYEKSDSLDKALQILTNADTENARRQKVRLLITYARYADAQTAIDNLPLATQEEQQFAGLQQLQHDLRSQSQTYKDLTTAQLSALSDMAVTQTTQSAYARSILHFVQHTPFNPDMPVILPASGKTTPVFATRQNLLLTLTPNPAATNVFVNYRGTEKENLQVVLYTITGKEQLRQNMLYGNAQLHAANLPAGLYLCVVQNETGSIIAQEKLSIVR